MTSKLGIIFIVVIVLLLGGGAFLVTKDSSKPVPSPEPNTYEYFWGDGCPHCKIVADFFESWENKDKIKINKLEVWNNTKNASLMNERAKICNIARTEMGVPFMVTPDGTCLSGDQPIIDHFKSLTF
jgi:thiol-disulfide isomerase/thioredoxin